MMGISTKWPAARLRGPDVAQEQALDFIMKTDPFLVGGGFTNDRLFEAEYRRLSGLVEPDYNGEEKVDWSQIYQREERFKKALGHIDLQHLASHWVANTYIGGPCGPVSPSGKVLLAINFGKWPDEDEIEDDLSKLASAFPWLTFDLSVWGNSEEGDEGLPSNTWHLEAGKWEAVEPKILQVSFPDVLTTFLTNFNRPGRETTWSVGQIRKMWGDPIDAARIAADVAA
jgi:hypothetical protein